MFDALGNFYPDYPGQPDPRFMNQMTPAVRQWPAQQVQQQPAAAMTPPTIHAEIIQTPSIEQGLKTPVAAGCSQMFITTDEKTIFVKSVSASADSYSVEYYDKRPPAPPAPVFDPQNYLTRQETAALIDERLRAMQPVQQPAPVSVQPAAPAPMSTVGTSQALMLTPPRRPAKEA